MHMTAFDESQHPRDRAGQFASHVGAEQEGALADEGPQFGSDGRPLFEAVSPTDYDPSWRVPDRVSDFADATGVFDQAADTHEDDIDQSSPGPTPPQVENPYGSVAYIDGPADDHGEPCGYCGELDAPTVTNVYYVDDSGERQLISVCVDCAPQVVADNHRGDRDALIEVSLHSAGSTP